MAELSQLPDEVNLSFVAGDTFRIRVRIIDPTQAEPMPLTAYKFNADIAQNTDNAIVGSFVDTVDPDSGNPPTAIILTLSPTETEKLYVARPQGATEFHGRWDLEVTFPPVAPAPTGDIRTVAKGTVTCYNDVTTAGP